MHTHLHLISHQVSSRFFCPVYGGGIVNFGRTPLHFAVGPVLVFGFYIF
jgi:hypothetical protein